MADEAINDIFKDDKLNRKPFIEKNTERIIALSKKSDGSYVLGVNGQFGAGKTTLISMWEEFLKEKKDELKISNVITLNAWESDFTDDPMIPIINSIKEELEKDTSFLEKNKNFLENLSVSLATQVASKTLLMFNHYIEGKTGVNFKEAYDSMGSRGFSAIGNKISANYITIKEAHTGIKKALREYTKQKGEIIIFVDELDRARPDYAVQFLEIIKHLFDIKGICFVLAINKEQLELSVKQLYGGIDFNNYYVRFISHELYLPEADEISIDVFIQNLAEQHQWNTILGENRTNKICNEIEELCYVFKMKPRQIKHLFNTLSSYINFNAEIAIPDLYLTTSLTLMTIRVVNPKLYNKIADNSLTYEDFQYFISLTNEADHSISALKRRLYRYTPSNDFIAELIYFSFPLPKPYEYDKSHYVNIARALKLNETAMKEKMEQTHYQARHYDVSFKRIYDNLESWSQFIS